MTASTLPAFSTLTFPQHTYEGALLDRLTRLADKAVTASELVACHFNDEKYSCREKAVVSDLETGQEFCLDHFAAVIR
jgi:hypothetical protein